MLLDPVLLVLVKRFGRLQPQTALTGQVNICVLDDIPERLLPKRFTSVTLADNAYLDLLCEWYLLWISCLYLHTRMQQKYSSQLVWSTLQTEQNEVDRTGDKYESHIALYTYKHCKSILVI